MIGATEVAILTKRQGPTCRFFAFLCRTLKLRRDIQLVHRLNDDAQVMTKQLAQRDEAASLSRHLASAAARLAELAKGLARRAAPERAEQTSWRMTA